MIFHAKRDDKKVEVATLVSDKIDFKKKYDKRQTKQYRMIQRFIQEED